MALTQNVFLLQSSYYLQLNHFLFYFLFQYVAPLLKIPQNLSISWYTKIVSENKIRKKNWNNNTLGFVKINNVDSKHAVKNMKTDWGGPFVIHIWWRMSFYEWINECHALLPLLPPELSSPVPPFIPVPPFAWVLPFIPPVLDCSRSLENCSLLPTNVLFLVSWLLWVLWVKHTNPKIQR